MLSGIQAMALGLMMIGTNLEAEGNDRNKGTGAKRELNCTILNVLCKVCISILLIITNYKVYIFHLKI